MSLLEAASTSYPDSERAEATAAPMPREPPSTMASNGGRRGAGDKKAFLGCAGRRLALRIWFDVLTPKQVVFFEPMISRLRRRHEVLCTSRRYREAAALARLRGLDMEQVGRHGGAGRAPKLEAGLSRARALARRVSEFGPDCAVSLCSPEASRVAFGLGIRHVAFSDAPHAEAVMRLSVPLVQRLLVPWFIPKSEFARYGIRPSLIRQYRAIDGAWTAARRPAGPRLGGAGRTVLVRPAEVEASYMRGRDRAAEMAAAIAAGHPGWRVVVLARYAAQARQLRAALGRRARVVRMSYDGRALLDACDLFVGSGGTMTSEAALSGIPTISYEGSPNPTEKYLVRRGLAARERDPRRIASAAARMMGERARCEARAAREVSRMEDPYLALCAALRSR